MREYTPHPELAEEAEVAPTVEAPVEKEWTICTPPTGIQVTKLTITDLKEGGEYQFRVCAINSEGVGEAANVHGTVVTSDRADAPEMELDADLRKVVSVRAGGTLRLFVTIRGRPEPSVKWEKLESTLTERASIDTTTSYTMLVIDNVNRFDSGKYSLTLENSSGTKSAVISVRILDTPSAPQNFAVKELKKDSVTLAWDTPVNDGGAKITNYIVEKRESVRKAYTTVTSNCTANSFKIEELPEGGIFYFRVCAVNAYGQGQAVETKEIKVSEVPQPPNKVTLVDVTKTSASLAWEKPVHDGGSKVMCYNVEFKPKSGDKWGTACTVKVPEATVPNLNPNEAYLFRVVAINEKGKSEPKDLGLPVVAKDVAIEPSVNLLFTTYSVKAGDDLTIEVPVRGRPKPVVSWKKDGLPLKQTSSITIINAATSSKIIFKGASREHVGKYEITLANTAGTVTASIGVVVLDKPGPPKGVKVDDVTSDSITLSWSPPDYDGGCSISNYIVEKRDTNTQEWHIVASNVARTAIKAGRLTHGAEYQFRIYAVNRYGKSSALDSPGITAQYNFRQPGPPSTPIVKLATKSYMLVTWNEPVTDGGSAVLGYHLERKERSSILWNKMNRGMIKDTEYKVTGIEEALESEPIKITDPYTIPTAPAGVDVTSITGDSMTLTWCKPVSDGGSPIAGYVIERREKTGMRWIRVNRDLVKDVTMVVTKLRKGCEYDFRVYAENAAGLSPASEPSATFRALDPLVVPSRPSKPKIISSTKDTVSIFWRPPTDDGGTPILGYSVEYREYIPKPEPEVEDEEEYEEEEEEPESPEELARWVEAIPLTKSLEFTVPGLKTDVEYEFCVKAINKVGSSVRSPYSDPAAAADRTAEPSFDADLEMRKVLVVKHGTSFTLRVPFKGKPTPSVEWSREGVDLKVRGTIESTESSTSLTIEKSTRNDSGEYCVTIESPLGKATLPMLVKVLDSPGPPLNVKVSSDSVTLAWTRPEYDGGSRITSYFIEAVEKGQTKWVKCATVKTLTHTIKSLREGAEYFFRVSAENHAGLSEPKEMIVPVIVKEIQVFILYILKCILSCFIVLSCFFTEAPEFDLKNYPKNTVYVKAGSDLTFEIPLTGKPMPKVTVSKNNVVIKGSKRLLTEVTPDSLIITLNESVSIWKRKGESSGPHCAEENKGNSEADRGGGSGA
uniref:Titin n=1 Tax=Fundulus heteroclitus TaxID=8078 RepID=A0A3Q2NTD6_FUNHE